MKQNTSELLKNINYKRLPLIRLCSNVSIKCVSDFLNISIKTYSKWENGETNPDAIKLKMLVTNYFQISIDDYLNENVSTEAIISSRPTNFKLPLENKQILCNSALETKTIIKERLPLLRQINNKSQQFMADQLNIRLSDYKKIEEGMLLVDAIMLKNIVTDILYYSLADFLDSTIPIDELNPLPINALAREQALKVLIKEKLPKLREYAKISVDEMALHLGVDKQLYLNWEQGYKLIDVLSLKKIVVDVLHITLEDFLNDDKSSKLLSLQSWGGLQPFLLNSQEQSFIMYYRK